MKLPRISVGAIMGGLVVVALDCVIVRSIQARPEYLDLIMVVFATLPMANLLSVGLAWLVSGRARARWSLVGFVVGGWCSLFATIVGIGPTLDLVDSTFEAVGLENWFDASPIHQAFAWFVFVGLLPFLFQLLTGLAGGWIAGRFGNKPGPAPVVSPSLGRLRVLSLLVLVVLVTIPAVVVEGVLRWKVDPCLARLTEGSEAVVDLADPLGRPTLSPPSSPASQLDRAKVQIVEDRGPNALEVLAPDTAWTSLVRDTRAVRVKVIEGPLAGESAVLPHGLLRPIR